MKILIVRFSSIGDIVLTTPVVSGLYRHINNVEIHYLTKLPFAPLLAHNPKIKKIYTIEKNIDEVIHYLKAEKYDYLIDLHHNLRTFMLKRNLKIPHHSFRKLNIQKWLLVNFRYNKMPHLHIVDRYFETVRFLGVTNNFEGCELFFSPSDVIDTYKRWNLSPQGYLAVAIGAQFATKMLPINLLIDILKKVNFPIILLGGKNDKQRSLQLLDGLHNHSQRIVNAVDQLSLMESASVVSSAKAILTHDTGLMHIATAFKIPIVSVWGNTVPALGMYPYYPKDSKKYSVHQVEELSCRPCSKIGYDSCPKKHFHCMTLQNVDSICVDILSKINQQTDY